MDHQHESMPGFWSILDLRTGRGGKGGLCVKAAMEPGHNLKLSSAVYVLFAVTEMVARDGP